MRNVYRLFIALEGVALLGLYVWGGWRCVLIGLILPMLVDIRIEFGKRKGDSHGRG